MDAATNGLRFAPPNAGVVASCPSDLRKARAVADTELTGHQAVAADILLSQFGADEICVHETWWSNVVVSGRTPSGRVFCKASAEHSVQAEATVARVVRAAGVPAPRVIEVGTHEQLPGGLWLAMAGVAGQPWQPARARDGLIATTIDDMARVLVAAHGEKRTGYGWVDDDGNGGSQRWSDWLVDALHESMMMLSPTDLLPGDFEHRAEQALTTLARDDVPGGILNGDLGLSEVFVEPATGRVTGLVDWGSALVGDPLYDVATFVLGGPAGDPLPPKLAPRLLDAYAALDPSIRDRPDGLAGLYRMLNHLANACWSIENDVTSWTADLCAEVVRELGTATAA